jgi:hypothetical protein
MADGSEPFSMIYADVSVEADTAMPLEIVARELLWLITRRLVGVIDGDAISTDLLVEHYSSIDEELSKQQQPFYYSRGEYFFEMTALGREAWDAYELADGDHA